MAKRSVNFSGKKYWAAGMSGEAIVESLRRLGMTDEEIKAALLAARSQAATIELVAPMQTDHGPEKVLLLGAKFTAAELEPYREAMAACRLEEFSDQRVLIRDLGKQLGPEVARQVVLRSLERCRQELAATKE